VGNNSVVGFYIRVASGGVSRDNLIRDSVISGTTLYDVYVIDSDTNNTFLNTSFDKSKLFYDDSTSGTVYFKWYLDVYVEWSNGNAVSGANVTIEDANSNLVNWSLTNSNGYITRQNLTEYYQNITSSYYSTNYTITASKNPSNSTEVNLTASRTGSNKITLTLQASTCSDGTAYSECSTNKPYYCDAGTLVQACSTCGCSSNSRCQDDGTCKSTNGGGSIIREIKEEQEGKNITEENITEVEKVPEEKEIAPSLWYLFWQRYWWLWLIILIIILIIIYILYKENKEKK